MTACLICGSEFSQRTFEAKLIGDTDFCASCWKEIMTTEYQSDVDEIIQPQMRVSLA